MAQTWLIKVKAKLSNRIDAAKTNTSPTNGGNNKMMTMILSRKKSHHIGVLAFEIASLMSKLLQLWQSLSDKNIYRLRHDSISIEGVRKIVSNDEAFLLGLACAEVVESLRVISKAVSMLGKRCDDTSLRNFDNLFDEFANNGRDPHSWVLSSKEMEAKQKKIDRYISSTASLYREMDEHTEIEHVFKKVLQCSDHESLIKEKKISDIQQKLFWLKQEVKHLKESSLWNKSFDSITSILARSTFTCLARIKLVFGIGTQGVHPSMNNESSLPRSSSVSATVYPSSPTFSGEVDVDVVDDEKEEEMKLGFFEANSKLLKAPPSTLGAAALALHYSNLIIVIEKMIRSPQLVGIDARDDLYGMLPTSIRVSLRDRLKGVGFSASDPSLATEWRDALGRILSWLSPLSHNMIKWQSERSFEQQNLIHKNNVLLLQTLFFANQAKAEAAITELLVGLNYIWRFEREMNAKALFQQCANNINNNGFLNNYQKSSC
ncbi:hypothetical protein MKW98_029608 [Papaver atlanticum]|uniref:DUF3475 domain-containing protein n=1 Tax=Papaver atlanticum TaxID=357466 RepID=A0AAD4XPB2_9MAGN|nr:hypothetical protein MKW98_029608 [Papaver atlanticum]